MNKWQAIKAEQLKQFTTEELAQHKELMAVLFPPKPPRKAPVKRPKVEIPEWVWERYEKARYEWHCKHLPNVVKDGHYPSLVKPDVSKANGLGWFIVDYMDWIGGDGDKKHITGRKVNGKWIPTTTKKGGSDVICIHPANGFEFSIEIKVGKDRPSEAQLARQAKTRSIGGVYEFVRTPMDFFAVVDMVGKIIVSRPLGLFD